MTKTMPLSADELFKQALQLDQDDVPLAPKQDAASLYQQAADLGHADAAFNLALMYSNGELGEPNKHKAAVLYQQAADLRHASATFNLAVMYDNGELGEPDKHKAATLYQQAADLGHAAAAFNLALMCSKGELGEPDKNKAAMLYQQAANFGDASATFNLALMYDIGELGEPDKNKAVTLYQQAADLGHAKAAFNLALMYDNGELGEPDKAKAAVLYQQAADLDDAEAAFNLALMYSKGELGEPDKAKAAVLYQQASDLGHANAAFNLAVLHRRGDLGEKDLAAADKWFKRASELGNPTAHLFLPYRGISLLTSQVNDLPLRDELERALRGLDDCFIDIRRNHLLDDKTHLAHFTGWRALESMLPVNAGGEAAKGRNVLRQYHVDYMNDPKEGHRLLDFANPAHEKAQQVSKRLRILFDDQYHHHQRQCLNNHELLPSVFICSLTLDSDRLDLWRAYGNDGDGYCLSFAFDGSAQMDAGTILQRDNQHVFHPARESKKADHDATDDAADSLLVNSTPPTLYEVRYRDEDIAATLDKLHAPLNTLAALRPQLADEDLQNELDACMTAMLLELLYLYKDEQYVTEREVRAVRMLPLDDSRIRSDERTPGRLYIETNPFLFTTESNIVVGPKVPGKEQLAAIWNLRWRLTKHGFSKTSKVAQSQVGYR